MDTYQARLAPPLTESLPSLLIVDDDADLRESIEAAVPEGTCKIYHARDGVVALERLRTPPPVALVLLDLRMPRMNGLELLAALCADPTLPRGPIWLMSHEGDLACRTGAYPIAGILEKPLRLPTLLAVLATLPRG